MKENYYIIKIEGSLPFSLVTDYKRLNYKKIIPIVEDFTEIDRKHFKAFEPTSYEEAYKLPMIKVMKG
jgi:hypothetical protein